MPDVAAVVDATLVVQALAADAAARVADAAARVADAAAVAVRPESSVEALVLLPSPIVAFGFRTWSPKKCQ